jgi:signal transduction histidine kinase
MATSLHNHLYHNVAMPTQTSQPHQTKHTKTQTPYWRGVALDLACVPVTFFCTYALSSYFNFSEHYYVWARQYENNLDIDELLPALLASLLALLWFAKRLIDASKLLIQKNHALLQRILEVQEDERKRIARDLHDDLGQYLSAIKAQAASLLIDTNSSAEAHLTAKSITSSANHAYHATHNLICALRPVALDDLGLSAALENFIDTWRQINAVTIQTETSSQVNYQLQIHGDIDNYNETTNIAIFRIVQEALTNIAKHAQAHAVLINIESNVQYLTITITDDGVGFEASQHAGYGLLGMAERAEALAGSMKISSRSDATLANTGTKINIQIKV